MTTFTRTVFIYLWILSVMLVYRSSEAYFSANPTPIYFIIYIPLVYLYLKKTNVLIYGAGIFTIASVISSKSVVADFFALQAYIQFTIVLISYLYATKRNI